MLVNNNLTNPSNLSVSYLPLGQLPEFDRIPPELMECIGECMECLTPLDQPSWSVYRNSHYFHVLFKPRIHEERRNRIVQWEKELDAGFSLFQNYKRAVNLSLFSEESYRGKWLERILDRHISNTTATMRQYWLEHLSFLKYGINQRTSFLGIPPLISTDSAITSILNICHECESKNVQRLREMARSVHETIYSDFASFNASDISSYDARIVTIRSHSIFKQALGYIGGICLIAKHVLNEMLYPNRVSVTLTDLSAMISLSSVSYIFFAHATNNILSLTGKFKEIEISTQLMLYDLSLVYVEYFVTGITFYHGFHLSATIRRIGVSNALLLQKESLKENARIVKHIWQAREVLTDAFVEGVVANLKIAIKCVAQKVQRAAVALASLHVGHPL